MAKREVIKVGLLFSVTGPYRTIGRAMRNGAVLGIEEVNRDPAYPFRFETTSVDPGGDNRAYANAARRMLADDGVVHVVGCYTSSSRKEVLPFFEKHDGLLWYPSHYEGFESSENVVYTGAAPNQHIVPLADYLLKHCGITACFIGSNYIWAWENNKIMREAVQGAGGQVLAERYLPVGETDFEGIIRQILDSRPGFVFNTLIGDSAYAFFRAFRATANAQGIEQQSAMSVASCSLAEPELVEIGAEAADGHISSSVYFESVQTDLNRQFVRAYHARFPEAGPSCADVEASYLAVHLLARAIRRAGTDEMVPVRAAVSNLAFEAPQGRVHIDRDNRHCYLTPRIGISSKSFAFDIIYEAPRPVKPDPYLVWDESRREPVIKRRPNLTVLQ